MKVVMAAGSSGGHLFPAVATARRLKERSGEHTVSFVGSHRKLDAQIIKSEKHEFSFVTLERKILKDLIRSFSTLRRDRPDIVIGFGGYVSFPVVLAARALGIPTMIHEQNLYPGRANRVLAHVADRIAVSFKETGSLLMRRSGIRETGNPLRATLVPLEKAQARAELGLDVKRITILVMGGSQGAHSINTVFLEMVKGLDEGRRDILQVIHMSGPRDLDLVRSEYAAAGLRSKVFSFCDNMSQVYSASDVVVSRAGASSIAEITFFGLPAVLIPYPVARVHQIDNARFMERNGAAIVLQQKDLSAKGLEKAIFELMAKGRQVADNSRRLARPEATEWFVEEIIDLFKMKNKKSKTYD